jgi:hypothetical protein
VLHTYRLVLLLAALAVGGGLAFAAAASQAAIPPPLAAKASAPSAADAGASSADSGNAIDAGKNLGELISSWGAALLLPVAGIMGFAGYGRAGVGGALAVAAITLIVGGFIFAPEEVQAFIRSIWHTLRHV